VTYQCPVPSCYLQIRPGCVLPPRRVGGSRRAGNGRTHGVTTASRRANQSLPPHPRPVPALTLSPPSLSLPAQALLATGTAARYVFDDDVVRYLSLENALKPAAAAGGAQAAAAAAAAAGVGPAVLVHTSVPYGIDHAATDRAKVRGLGLPGTSKNPQLLKTHSPHHSFPSCPGPCALILYVHPPCAPCCVSGAGDGIGVRGEGAARPRRRGSAGPPLALLGRVAGEGANAGREGLGK
jgi:hypothetical protein